MEWVGLMLLVGSDLLWSACWWNMQTPFPRLLAHFRLSRSKLSTGLVLATFHHDHPNPAQMLWRGSLAPAVTRLSCGDMVLLR
jgi:hypothetical protein